MTGYGSLADIEEGWVDPSGDGEVVERRSGRSSFAIALCLAFVAAVAIGTIGHGLVAERGSVELEVGKLGSDASLSYIEYGKPESKIHPYQKRQLTAMTCGVGACSADGCDEKAFTECTKMTPAKRTQFVEDKMPNLKMVDGVIETLPDDKELMVRLLVTPGPPLPPLPPPGGPPPSSLPPSFRFCIREGGGQCVSRGLRRSPLPLPLPSPHILHLLFRFHGGSSVTLFFFMYSLPSLLSLSQEAARDGKAVLGKIPKDDQVANCGAGACEMDKGCDKNAFTSCMKDVPQVMPADGGVRRQHPSTPSHAAPPPTPPPC